MKTLHLLILICLVLAPSLLSQVSEITPTRQNASVEQFRQDLLSLKGKYDSEPILQDSEDYKIFTRLLLDLGAARLLVPELIDLTGIRRKRPGTSESFSAYSLSPAGGVLLSLREAAEPEVRARLAKGGLSDGQREVLEQVIRAMEKFRSQKREGERDD